MLLANAGASGPSGASGAALASSGGDITLGTGSSGLLTINGGDASAATRISMQGSGDASTDGTLTLRAYRTPDDLNVQVQVNNGSALDLVTRQPVIVEGVKAYSAVSLGSTDAGCGTGGSCDVADLSGLLYTDAATFAGNSAAIGTSLGLANVQVRPGIEVDSGADLVVNPTTGVWIWGVGLRRWVLR